MLGLPDQFILLDTEFTSWEGSLERDWSAPNEYQEVVQIGAVRVDGERLEEVDFFTTFVRPQKNPILSDYFTRLTGISQEVIDRTGVDLSSALARFHDWCASTPLYCYGNDGKTLEANCLLLGIPFPFEPSRFHHVKTIFERLGVSTEGYMSSTLVQIFGKIPSRRAHDALNDARTVLDALRELAKKEGLPAG